MAATASADVLEAMLEKVHKNVTELFETSNTVAARIKRSGQAEKLSEKLYRFPLLQYPGGVYGKYSADAGTMLNGSGPLITKMTAAFLYSEYAFELGQQAIDLTDDNEKSVYNTKADTIGKAMDQLEAYDDIGFHDDGTGKLTEAASAGGAASLTFAGATDYQGVSRLRQGQLCAVYNSSGTAYMTANHTITAINRKSKAVTFSASFSETGAAGDYLVFPGITTTPPVSFQSTYPATITADDWRHGLRYFNDYTASRYVLGLLKSTVPELLPASVNASGDDISFEHGQTMLDELQDRRDEDAIRGLWGLAHMTQRAKILALSRHITSKFITDSQVGKSVDQQPTNNSYSSTFDFCGIECTPDKRQMTNRMDFIVPEKWGRAIVKETGFMKNPGGGFIFQGRASTGALKASILFKITQGFDWFNQDPGCGGVIYGLGT